MAIEVFKNFATAVLTVAVSTTPAAGTLETWTVGSTSSLPSITSGVSQFRCQVNNPSGTVTSPEIVIVTQILSGTTVQVSRGAESSSILPHNVGDVLTLVQTAYQMQPTPWIAATLAGTWAYYGAGAHPGYRVTAIGDVQLCGMLSNPAAGSGSSSTKIFGLPNPGFIPQSAKWLSPGAMVVSTSISASAILTVDPNPAGSGHSPGDVYIQPEGSSGSSVLFLSLDGVRFPLTNA